MTRPPDPLWGEGIGQSPNSKPDFMGFQYTPSSLRMQDAEQRYHSLPVGPLPKEQNSHLLVSNALRSHLFPWWDLLLHIRTQSTECLWDKSVSSNPSFARLAVPLTRLLVFSVVRIIPT